MGAPPATCPVPARDVQALIREHHDMVRGTCRRVLVPSGAGDEVDDAVQETFISMAEQLSGPGDGPESLGAWLRTVATRKSLSRLRVRRSRRRRERALVQAPEAPLPAPVTAEEAAVLDACIAELGDTERDLIVRIFYAGESQAEIASAGGVSRVAVHKRLQRALDRLRGSMQRRGVRIGLPALLLLLADGDRKLAAAAGPIRSSAVPGPAMAVAAVAAAALVAGCWWALPDPAASVPTAGAADPPIAVPGPPSVHRDPVPDASGIAAGLEGHGDQRGMGSGNDPQDRVPLRFQQTLDGRPLVPLATFRAAIVNPAVDFAVHPVSSCPGIQVRRIKPDDRIVLAIRAPAGMGIGLMSPTPECDPGIEVAVVYQEESAPGTWVWRTMVGRHVRDGRGWLSEMTLLASDDGQRPRRAWQRVAQGDEYTLGFPHPVVVHLASATVLSEMSCRTILEACPGAAGAEFLDP